LKLLCGSVAYFFIHAFSSQCLQVSSIVTFSGQRSNHQKLLKMSLGVLIWLIIHKYNIRTQHLIAPLPFIMQWLSDNMVSAKIAEEGLIRSCSYSKKTLAASKLMTPI
jgi:hypothetical protein